MIALVYSFLWLTPFLTLLTAAYSSSLGQLRILHRNLLGQSLEVEELGDRLEVCKSRTQGLRSHAGETIREVQTRRKDVKGDLDARHFVVGSGCVDVVGSR